MSQWSECECRGDLAVPATAPVMRSEQYQPIKYIFDTTHGKVLTDEGRTGSVSLSKRFENISKYVLLVCWIQSGEDIGIRIFSVYLNL